MNQQARQPFQPVQPSTQVAQVAQPAPQALSRGPSVIQTFAAKFNVDPDKVMATLRATAFRQKAKAGQSQEVTNEQMMALLIVANQFGLNPFLKEIYAFPSEGGIVPVVGIDGWLRLANDHPQFDGMTVEMGQFVQLPDVEKTAPYSCTVTIHRKDRKYPTVKTEYIADCYRPIPIWDGKPGKPGPWQSHPTRMLEHKATIQAIRYAFGFGGIHDEDDADSIVATQSVHASEAAPQRLGVEQLNEHLNVDTRTGEVVDAEFADPGVEQERREPDPGTPQRTQRTRGKAAAPAESKPKPPTQGVQAQGIGPGEVGTPGVEHRENVRETEPDADFNMGD